MRQTRIRIPPSQNEQLSHKTKPLVHSKQNQNIAVISAYIPTLETLGEAKNENRILLPITKVREIDPPEQLYSGEEIAPEIRCDYKIWGKLTPMQSSPDKIHVHHNKHTGASKGQATPWSKHCHLVDHFTVQLCNCKEAHVIWADNGH